MEDTVFYDILYFNEDRENNLMNFVDIQGKVINILIKNCQFIMMSFFSHLLFIKNYDGNFSLISTFFDQNEIFQEILYAYGLFDLIINTSKFLHTNNRNESLFFFGGGNLLLINCLNKRIENLEIKFAFSSKTPYGIKIVDIFDEHQLSLLEDKKV